jgi:hypothetical protein
MQRLTEQGRPLFGVNGVVCPKKERENKKYKKKFLTRAGIVRDVRFALRLPGITGTIAEITVALVAAIVTSRDLNGEAGNRHAQIAVQKLLDVNFLNEPLP